MIVSQRELQPTTPQFFAEDGGDVDQRVQEVVVLIRNNLHRNLSLETLASSVNLSRWYLSHLFKDEMRMSPVQYIKSVRLQEAKQLLETTSLSVKEVMAKVGIMDKSHFERDFKKAFGLTPARYKAQSSNARQQQLQAKSANHQ
jgi:transcriptional regulator GlxA family with amidase domain